MRITYENWLTLLYMFFMSRAGCNKWALDYCSRLGFFEWALAFKDLTSRKANDIFDEVVKLAVSLDLKISFSSSTQCVAGFDVTTDDGRNINLSVKVYKDVELQVGYFTYCKYVTQTKFDVKSKHVTLANLEPTFQSILRELADDHYVELNRA